MAGARTGKSLPGDAWSLVLEMHHSMDAKMMTSFVSMRSMVSQTRFRRRPLQPEL